MNARSALVVGITGVIIALLLGAMALWATSQDGAPQIQLGDTQFDAGFIGRMSEEIDARGPILYADAGSRGTRDLYVQHIGTDEETGWLAFSARRTADPRDCTAVWDTGTRMFHLVSASDEVCDAASFDELGCGLRRFPAEVIDGKVIVFLNEDFDEVAEALGETEDTGPVEGPDLSCPDE